jgi:hypothetical protein
MADKTDDMRQEIRKGRQDIAHTRSAITEKLAILEDRVQETVDGVKHTLDLRYQVKQRPWLMVGGSLLVGYTLGRIGRMSSTTHVPSNGTSYQAQRHHTIGSEAGGLAAIKAAAFGAVMSTLLAMAKQVLLPPPDKSVALSPSREPMDNQEQITNRSITSAQRAKEIFERVGAHDISEEKGVPKQEESRV